MTIGPHLLGRTVEHDPRNWDHQHPRKIIAKRNVIHTLGAPCLDQDDVGSCEGNTAAEFLNSAKAINNRRRFWHNLAPKSGGSSRDKAYLSETHAVGLYSKATTLDNDEIPGVYPPTDTGTSGVGIAKAMKAFGGITQYNWTFSFDAFLAALQTQPVMLGTNWYQDMFDPDAKGYVQPAMRDQDPAGGHAYLALALDWRNERVGCQNHWADSWGVKIGGKPGRFWVKFPVMQRLLAERGDSLVPVLM